MSISVISVIFFLVLKPAAAQDTSFVKKDTIPPLLAESKYEYINTTAPDTITRSTFLWYPLKNFEDVFNFIPGYYLKYMDVGQVQNLSYNQLDYLNITALRHGRPVNDLLDGSLDFNLLSRNEVSEIEIADGNFLYNYSNAINIIDRKIFQNRPFSEISFWQDRFQNLYFDGSYSQNIFKRFNFNFGATKHSYDGKYTNSDFDKWLGRFNLNYVGSKNFNSFFNFNYARIQRGLNEGININTIPSLDRDVLFDETVPVKNPDAYEIRERFDIDLGFIFASSPSPLERGLGGEITKLQLFTSNSFRKYRDEENRPAPNGIYLKDNSHWIDYGVKLSQSFKLNLGKSFDFISRTEAEYNKDLIHTTLSTLSESERIFFIEDIELAAKNLSLQAYAKTFKLKYIEDKFYTDFGLRGRVHLLISNSSILRLEGSYSLDNHLPSYQTIFLVNPEPFTSNYVFLDRTNRIEASASFLHKYGELTAQYYRSDVNFEFRYPENNFSQTSSGINLKALFRISAIDFEAYFHQRFNKYNSILPQNSGSILLSYHNVLFKKKLEIKTGFTTRFWSDYLAQMYNGLHNNFYNTIPLHTQHTILANASLDFFIIGKINRAIFGLTLENILNHAYYTTDVYPNQDRGGLGTIISRFNITWFFLN